MIRLSILPRVPSILLAGWQKLDPFSDSSGLALEADLVHFVRAVLALEDCEVSEQRYSAGRQTSLSTEATHSPRPGAQTPIMRAARHSLWDFEWRLSAGDAVLVHREDDKVFGGHRVDVVRICNRKSASKKVGPLIAIPSCEIQVGKISQKQWSISRTHWRGTNPRCRREKQGQLTLRRPKLPLRKEERAAYSSGHAARGSLGSVVSLP